jgi:hypothetical protein
MHCAVHEIMGSRNLTGGKKGVNLAKKGVKIEFPIVYCEDIEVPVNSYRPLSSQLPVKVECRVYLNSLLPNFSYLA